MQLQGAPRSTLLLCSMTFVAGAVCSKALQRASRTLMMRLQPPAASSGVDAAAKRMPLIGDGTRASPRIAPDAPRAAVLIDAWRVDQDIQAALARGEVLQSEPVEYNSEAGKPLYGQLVWSEGASTGVEPRPGVLLVHTAVGPHDLFLQWKAEALAAVGLVVLIVDMFGDAAGDGWEKDFNMPARLAFREDRSLFRRRMELAMAALTASPRVDGSRVAALGFCFGGPAVLDFARSNPEGLRAAITFHGILDANPPPPGTEGLRAKLLLCHAEADPFVPPDSYNACTAQLKALGAHWSAMVFGGGALHSFTNPAQDLNPAPEFAYDQHAARASWVAAKDLMRETLFE